MGGPKTPTNGLEALPLPPHTRRAADGLVCTGEISGQRPPPHIGDEQITHIKLAALPVAAGLARHFASCSVRGWQLHDLAEPAELLVSELVTNAVKVIGASEPRFSDLDRLRLISVRLRAGERRLVIEVGDDDINPPVLRQPGDDAEGGRGLMLVELLSSRWGYFRPAAGGKVVWCELRVYSPV